MNTAFIFPGQGSQKVGMGKDFYDNFSCAKDVFDEVDSIIGYRLSSIIFDDKSGNLSDTIHTQPALMATSIAMLRCLEKESGYKVDSLCNIVAGHSLGEYTALCASDALTLEDTAKLLKVRGSSMQQSNNGAMAACIGIELDKLENILKSLDQGICQIANDNVDGQIVISGHDYNIDKVILLLKKIGYRCIKLNVSGAFHSELMRDAQLAMKNALKHIRIENPKIPVIANVTAEIANQKDIRELLAKQVCSSVRWRETMNRFSELKISEIIEIGSGRVLTGLAKKSSHNFNIYNISSVQDLTNFLDRLQTR